MYKEIETRTRRVKAWESRLPAGTEYPIKTAGEVFRGYAIDPWASPAGYGGQTVARILIEHCGWKRNKYKVWKPEPAL